MKFLAYAHETFEDSFVRELIKLINIKDACVNTSCVEFEINEHIKDKISELILYSRTMRRVMILLDKTEFKEFEDLKKHYENYFYKRDLNEEFNKIFDDCEFKLADNKIKTFCSRTQKHNNSDFNSMDLDAKIGEYIIENNKELKVNLENPDLTIFNLIIDNTVYFGIDLIGKDLSKRDYKVFTLPFSMKSSLVYAIMLKYIDDDFLKEINKKLVVNYGMSDGAFLIELAQYISKISPLKHSYREITLNKYMNLEKEFDAEKEPIYKIFGLDNNFNTTNFVKKNLALSDVKNIVQLSRLDLTWLDTKYEKKTIDLFFTFFISRSIVSSKEIEKYYNDLFYQLEFVLKGRAIILTSKPNIFMDIIKSEKYKLEFYEQHNFLVGNNSYSVIVLDAIKAENKKINYNKSLRLK